MTEEQIKQNARVYTNKEYMLCTGGEKEAAIKDFIAGAHSRNEEVVKLKKDVHDLEQALACAEDVADIQHKKLDQLRNPWRDAKKDPPKDEQQVYVSWGECNVKGIGIFCQDEKCWQVGWLESGVEVNYWMPIPELKKNK